VQLQQATPDSPDVSDLAVIENVNRVSGSLAILAEMIKMKKEH
jgi:hypothetical protein